MLGQMLATPLLVLPSSQPHPDGHQSIHGTPPLHASTCSSSRSQAGPALQPCTWSDMPDSISMHGSIRSHPTRNSLDAPVSCKVAKLCACCARAWARLDLPAAGNPQSTSRHVRAGCTLMFWPNMGCDSSSLADALRSCYMGSSWQAAQSRGWAAHVIPATQSHTRPKPRCLSMMRS